MENQAVDAVNLVQNGAYDLSIFSLFLRADPIVKLVIFGLFIASIWSWAIIINKIKMIPLFIFSDDGSAAGGAPLLYCQRIVLSNKFIPSLP